MNKRGAFAVPFAGNMPKIDLMARNRAQDRTVQIQVKTKSGGRSWHASILGCNGLNVGALQALIDRLKDEDKAILLKIIVTEQSWGLSAVKGSPDSYLVDELYAKVPGYTKIND